MSCQEKTLDSFPFLLYYSRGDLRMEKIVEQALLYDFYGELLTDYQKEVFEDVILHDYSLSEIAENQGISRQGVHDLVKRCNKLLTGYEEKLHLVEKFLKTKEKVSLIHNLTQEYELTRKEELLHEIKKISNEIINNL